MAKHRKPLPDGMSEMPRYAWEFNAVIDRQRAEAGRGRPAPGTMPSVPPLPICGADAALAAAETTQQAATEEMARLLCALSATIRSGRAQGGLSQRELARVAGLSQSVVARFEAGTTRLDGEYVRDALGRRLPAHLAPYRLRGPHSWWPGVTDISMWQDEPKWSYRRR